MGDHGHLARNLPFAARWRVDAGICVLALEGELDVATAPMLAAALADAGAAAAVVVVDLSGVTFLGAAAVRELELAYRRLRSEGGQLDLRQPVGLVGRVLGIVGWPPG